MTHLQNIETWKDVPSYKGVYQVSNFGNIKSLARTKSNGKGLVNIPERIIKGRDNGHGYLMVALYHNGKSKNYKLHRLVLYAFIGVSELQIDHIDMNRYNNNLSNLRYCTARENKRYSIDKNKTSSKYFGVTKSGNKWSAVVTKGGNQKYLGHFNCEFSAHVSVSKFLNA